MCKSLQFEAWDNGGQGEGGINWLSDYLNIMNKYLRHGTIHQS